MLRLSQVRPTVTDIQAAAEILRCLSCRAEAPLSLLTAGPRGEVGRPPACEKCGGELVPARRGHEPGAAFDSFAPEGR